jgi:hypothetical protein
MDKRLKKNLSAGGREDRASLDSSREAPEKTFVSTDEHFAEQMWKDEWTQQALPTAPQIPGFHVTWLSTTNSYDSIDKRIRLGYTHVTANEVSGFENYRVKAGEHVGFVACNEMLLFKIPNGLYQKIMKHFHHDAPLDEANKIRLDATKQVARDSSGRRLGAVEGEGMDNIDAPVACPTFEG